MSAKISLRVDDELLERIREAAKEDRRSVGGYIKKAITEKLEGRA